jgi:hypothetical protein
MFRIKQTKSVIQMHKHKLNRLEFLNSSGIFRIGVWQRVWQTGKSKFPSLTNNY